MESTTIPPPQDASGIKEPEKQDETITTTKEDEKPASLPAKQEEKGKDPVLEKLLDPTELSETVSQLWSGFWGGTSRILITMQANNEEKSAAQKVQSVAVSSAASVQTVASTSALKAQELASTIAQQIPDVKGTPPPSTEGSHGANSATKKNITSSPSKMVTPLPWDSLSSPELKTEARNRVLKLSMDDQSFLVPPPKEANFTYNVEANLLIAERLIQVDPLLGSKRFKLVPKQIDEVNFWTNYLYRVNLIVDALGVSLVKGGEVHQEKQNEENNNNNVQDPLISESASSTGGKQPWEEEMRKELETIKKNDESFDMMETDELDDEVEIDEDEFNELNNS